jgi:hypothetical protein
MVSPSPLISIKQTTFSYHKYWSLKNEARTYAVGNPYHGMGQAQNVGGRGVKT